MALTFSSATLIPATSMAASITSDPINLAISDSYSIHAIYTGSPNGTLSIEASIDGVTFSTIAGSSIDIAAAGNTLFNINQANYM